MAGGPEKKQAMRTRILGNDELPARVSCSWAWVEAELEPEPAVPAPAIQKSSALPHVDAGEGRYYREDFVRGKIESWARRPAGGQHHPLVVSEAMAARIEGNRGSVIPVDPTEADITARTFVAMDERMARVLQWYHTSSLRIGAIAKEVGTSYTECRRLLEQGHVVFVDEWETQRQRLLDVLRRMAPAVDPSRDAIPQIADARLDPWRRPKRGA